MANRNNLPNTNDNNEGDADQSPYESEPNATTTDVQQLTHLSESATDERSDNVQHMTNRQINRLTIRQPDRFRSTVPTHFFGINRCWHWYCLIFILFGFGIGQSWYWLIFLSAVIGIGTILYQVLTFNNQSSVKLGKCYPWHFGSPLDYSFGSNRHGNGPSRIAHPIDEALTYSTTVMIADDEPLGTEETQPHDMIIRVDLNNFQRADSMNIENDNVNEDATLYINGDNEIVTPIIQNSSTIQIRFNEDNAPQIVVDNTTCNINPLRSTESQDGRYSSGSNGEEGLEQNASFESGFDGDDEDHSSNDTGETNQASPNTGHIYNDAQLTQTVDVHRQSVRIELATDTSEIERDTNAPVENALPLICPTTIFIPKPTVTVVPNDRLNEEGVV